MDVEQAWKTELEDLSEPEEELEYWEDDDLTPDELTRWYGSTHTSEPMETESPGLVAWPPAEGSVPDLIAAVLASGGDPALMSDAELVDALAGWHAVASRAVGRELRATEELLRRRKPRVWDRRADRAETRREELDGVSPGEPLSGTDASASSGMTAPERAMPAVVPSREAAAEIAMALTATEYAAQVQTELAADLSRRLPRVFDELDAGRVDLARVRVLTEATQFLSDEDAGKVDALLAPLAGTMTTGDLRVKARHAVIKVDPAAADRRRKRAERKARFTLYGNDDQTATAMVERMPAHLGAAVKARVNAIARAAKAAGMTDPMPLLEAKVATGLLLDTLPEIPPPTDGDPAGSDPFDGGPFGGDPFGGGPSGGQPDPGPAQDPWDAGWPVDWFTGADAQADGSGSEPDPSDLAQEPDDGPEPDSDLEPDQLDPDQPECGQYGPSEPARHEPGAADPAGASPGAETAMAWPVIPDQAGVAGPGCAGLPAWLVPKDPGRIRLTVPWRTLTGIGREPGDLSWIGPVTPAQARELATAAAADPDCTWRLIVTDDEGHAVAITTLRTRRGTGTESPGLVSEVTVTIQQSLAVALADRGKADDWIARALDRLNVGDGNFGKLAALLAKAIPAANIAATEAAVHAESNITAGGCAHAMEVPGYRVPDRLRRWLSTRDRTCRNPICRQPATRCDQDHTVAYHRGGRTCSCNLGGLCRSHHELKQLPGWRLTQDADGCFTWQTPSGLTYRKEPHCYPV